MIWPLSFVPVWQEEHQRWRLIPFGKTGDDKFIDDRLGKTDLIIGDWYSVYVHVPIPLATASRKKVDPESDLWHAVIAATGQPQTWE